MKPCLKYKTFLLQWCLILSKKKTNTLFLRSLATHLSHPEGDFIDLVDGHKCLHVVKQENIVEDGREQGQRAVEHCSGEDALPVARDAPAHSSFSITLLRLFSAPSCNHLSARPTQGLHLMIVCRKQEETSTETWDGHSLRFTDEREYSIPSPFNKTNVTFLRHLSTAAAAAA